MRWCTNEVRTGTRRQVAGWSSLITGALLLALLFNAGVTNGIGGVAPMAPTDILPAHGTLHAPYVQSGIHEGTTRTLSPASAALAAGGDVRARFLTEGPDAPCQLIVGQPLHAGQNTWVAQQSWHCADPRP